MGTRITPICIADGPTLTGTTPASCVPLSCARTVLDPYYWSPGKIWRLSMSGKHSTVVKSARGDLDELPGSLRLDLRFGNVVAWDTLACLLDPLAAATDLPWTLDAEIRCNAVSDGLVTFTGSGLITGALSGIPASQPRAGACAVVPWGTAPTAGASIDARIGLPVDVFFTQTNPRGSFTVTKYSIEEI